jgi:hypothetical protein
VQLVVPVVHPIRMHLLVLQVDCPNPSLAALLVRLLRERPKLRLLVVAVAGPRLDWLIVVAVVVVVVVRHCSMYLRRAVPAAALHFEWAPEQRSQVLMVR